jgi:hypothetical protein
VTRRIGSGLLAAGGFFAPRASEACAVCTAGSGDDTQRAFLLGTLLLSTLPFAAFGGIGLYLWRRLRRAEREVIRASSSPS